MWKVDSSEGVNNICPYARFPVKRIGASCEDAANYGNDSDFLLTPGILAGICCVVALGQNSSLILYELN